MAQRSRAERPRRGSNPADDFVINARLREPVRFTDLSERLAVKLSALPAYLSRAHFAAWHKRLGAPDFHDFTGVFTPLYHVDIEVTDATLGPGTSLIVRGHNRLAKSVDGQGEVRHLMREGRYEVETTGRVAVGRARFINVFTRYDPDPARRRVKELPAGLGLGAGPSRVIEIPELDVLLPAGTQAPDFADPAPRFWHYTQTDANRHVNGMEYLRSMEDFLSCSLAARGHDLRTLYPARARILYRKPCFRGEGYQRVAWFRGEAPLVLVGAFSKAGDRADAPPAVAIEVTFGAHEA